MWSKVIKIVLAALIFVGFGLTIPITQASAIGADTVIKAVGGKQVVRALAEKAGMALSPKQLDNVTNYIQKKSYDGDTKAIDFLTKANNVTPSATPATKSGFKKYVLEPALWISGLDLIFDAINTFQNAYDGDTTVNIYGASAPCGIVFGAPYEDSEGLNIDIQIPDSENWYDPRDKASAFESSMFSGGQYGMGTLSSYTDFSIRYASYSYSSGWLTVSYGYSKDGVDAQANMVYSTPEMPDCNNTESLQEYTPTSSDVVSTSNVDSSVKTNFDNDTYDNDTTYNIEIEKPENTSDDGDDGTVWNDKDTNITVEVDVDVDVDVDSDGDGTPDNNDSDDDNDGIPDDEDDGTPSTGKPVDWLVVVDDEIPIHEKFFLEMADMGQKIEDMYNGVVHFFDVSIDGFTTLTNGMTGFVSFLDSFFDWLPSEYRALLGSGFTLGVVAFFLRR